MSNVTPHPIVGDGYYPLGDSELEIELAEATIVERNPMFGSFTFIVGYRNPAYAADGKTPEPFVCIQNHLAGHPHLFITKD